MSYELIITEKPSAAQKIAMALADGTPNKQSNNGIPYYELTFKGKDIVIASAVGHLFTVTEKEKKKGWSYPIFDLKWEQSSKVNKGAAFTSKYASTIKALAKNASEYTVATDYDIEGEVIGMNCIVYLCKKKDASRMKFSTLTKPDIVKAYEGKSKTLDWGQALAGRTRHELDWYYGINLSRALSLAIKAAGAFKILSSGRIQGPALKLVVEKEREIGKFIATPFWELSFDGTIHTNPISAMHVKDKFTDQAQADAAHKAVKDKKDSTVTDVRNKEFKQAPPTPFDLTTLQIECHRVHRIEPKVTLSLAQDLYVNGFISYPRTSSQKLPKELDHKKLIEGLKAQAEYKELAERLLAKKVLKPNEGKKKDDAHPAIYPTGQKPAKLDAYAAKLYDLIVRRFLATFADEATRATMTVTFDTNNEKFIAKGTRTVHKGWHEFYGKYAQFEDVTLPKLDVGDKAIVKEWKFEEKKTKPPKRFTSASIIKELEKQNLGTKSTRATIIDNLYERGYVHEKSIEVTRLGMRTCETLEKYSPRILDAKLTRDIEEEMDEIRKNTKKPEEVLDHSRDVLTSILTEFKEKEADIGKELLSANKETMDIDSFVGTCQTCKDGDLKIRRGKFGMFIACGKYPDCKTTFSLPKGPTFKPNLDHPCEACGFPTIIAKPRAKPPQTLCINPDCSAKDAPDTIDGEGKECEKCKKGTMMLRKSLYGTFLGCSNYPKCKTIIQSPKKAKK
ncbi:MAG: DNA topoisomerase-1 [Candidatus Woesearchaeota archaeon]|jgi:DNA topoisomerase-1